MEELLCLITKADLEGWQGGGGTGKTPPPPVFFPRKELCTSKKYKNNVNKIKSIK